jgi:hypothetical protein
MLTAVVALVVYVAAAFFGADEPRYAVFTSKEACDQAVAEVRASGTFASDCVAVTIPAPKNGAPRT